jgi:hypothetical protein
MCADSGIALIRHQPVLGDGGDDPPEPGDADDAALVLDERVAEGGDHVGLVQHPGQFEQGLVRRTARFAVGGDQEPAVLVENGEDVELRIILRPQVAPRFVRRRRRSGLSPAEGVARRTEAAGAALETAAPGAAKVGGDDRQCRGPRGAAFGLDRDDVRADARGRSAVVVGRQVVEVRPAGRVRRRRARVPFGRSGFDDPAVAVAVAVRRRRPGAATRRERGRG